MAMKDVWISLQLKRDNGVRGNYETEIMLCIPTLSILYALALLDSYVQGSRVIRIIPSPGCQSM